MLLRMASSSSAAVVVTGALLLVMAGFVAQDAAPRITARPVFAPDFIFEPPPPPEVVRRERPQPPAKPPEQPEHTLTHTTDIGIVVTAVRPGEITPPTGPRGLRAGLSDGDLLPIVTIAPTYPPAAERRNLEGYVIVSFTVLPNGSVANARVTESSHTVFERAAVEAALRFRFRPRVVDGQPVAVDRVRRRISFSLED